jgi:hypothetical protein
VELDPSDPETWHVTEDKVLNHGHPYPEVFKKAERLKERKRE